MDVDYLLSYGPIEGAASLWYDKNFFTAGLGTQVFTTGTGTTFTFTISNVPSGHALELVCGVTANLPFSVTYNDYGNAAGSQSFSGTSVVPLPNQLFPAPNNGDWQYSGRPYAKYNSATPHGDPSVTVVFPSSVSGITITIYYLYAVDSGKTNQTALEAHNMAFERVLGQVLGPITYTDFSGVVGIQITLGAANVLSNYTFEMKGLYSGASSRGDANPADIIADIVTSGNSFWVNPGTSLPIPVWNHGLSLTSFAPPGIFGTVDVNPAYSRFAGVLADEPNFWNPIYSGNGSNVGLNALRNYCQAYGIFISGVLDSQQTAAQLLDTLCEIANCAAVWDGARLNFIPYCEVSQYGFGASYVAPTAAGPLFTLSDKHFLGDASNPPVTLLRTRGNQNYNSLSIQYTDRSNMYNVGNLTVADALDITTQGAMPGTTKSWNWIQDNATASAVGWAQLRRELTVNRVSYKFKLGPAWSLLTPMDLVTIVDPSLPSSPAGAGVPVRITKITEKEDFSLEIEAEPFLYGASVPATPNATLPSGSGIFINQNVDPGVVNTPIIFESIPKLSTSPQLWFGLSGSNPNYGGCEIWLSTDGGNTYNVVGMQSSKNTMGVVYSSTLPSQADPDTVDTLNVDLTESLGTLLPFTAAQADAFQSLCYLEPGGTVTVNGQTLTIPYELVAYSAATLAAANKYALGTRLRRGVFGTPITSHAIGQKFSFLEDGNIFKLALNPNWIGTTLYFKFTAFNIYGGHEQQLSDPSVVAYTFTPTGAVGWTNTQAYSVTPSPAVYQGKAGGWPSGTGGDTNATTWTDPTKVYFPNVTAHFPQGDANYVARDSGLVVFTSTAGGQQAWVTIQDPTQGGEPTGSATLTAYADLNQTRWNTPGYTRIGTITSVQYASGGGGGTGGGGGSSPGSNPYIITYFEGDGASPAGSQVLLRLVVPSDINSVTLPQSLTGSAGGAKVAPTGSIVITIKQNGTSIGSLNIAASATTMTFTFSAAVTLNPGDILDFVMQASPDSTLAGVFWSVAGTRN
jgi:hypothetical protein